MAKISQNPPGNPPKMAKMGGFGGDFPLDLAKNDQIWPKSGQNGPWEGSWGGPRAEIWSRNFRGGKKIPKSGHEKISILNQIRLLLGSPAGAPRGPPGARAARIRPKSGPEPPRNPPGGPKWGQNRPKMAIFGQKWPKIGPK